MNQDIRRDNASGDRGRPASGTDGDRPKVGPLVRWSVGPLVRWSVGPLATEYKVALGLAIVAGIFSVVVSALLWMDFSRRKAEDPLDTPQFKALKADLVLRPQDEDLKQQIRDLDLELRKAYFRQRKFTQVGSWLLLCGVAVFLAAGKWARTLRQNPPMPEPEPTPQDTETNMTRTARWSVAVFAIVLVGVAILLSWVFRSELPETTEELAAMMETDRGDQQPQRPTRPAESPAIPLDEETLRNWPRFRGPGGLGISHHADVPTTWDGASGEGILWKKPVPLEGNSSPVLWNGRVFLTGANDRRREVYCFDADTGELLWQKDVPGDPQAAEPPEVMEDTATRPRRPPRTASASTRSSPLGTWPRSISTATGYGPGASVCRTTRTGMPRAWRRTRTSC